jgi:hypothetical protein
MEGAITDATNLAVLNGLRIVSVGIAPVAVGCGRFTSLFFL